MTSKVRLISNDGEVFEVDESEAKLSQFIAGADQSWWNFLHYISFLICIL